LFLSAHWAAVSWAEAVAASRKVRRQVKRGVACRMGFVLE